MSEAPSLLVAGLLTIGALILVGPGPSWVARWHVLRRVPRAGVVLWQAGSLAALICVLGVAWILVGAVRSGPPARWGWVPALAAAGFAVVVVTRLAWALLRVAASTASRRQRHRDLVDLLTGDGGGGAADGRQRLGVRVLGAAQPLAYCLPGLRRSRVVVSAGTIAILSDVELDAVLAHERAHLLARHDLVLAGFDAVHQAFPYAIRSELPADQARLLVEMLADDAAVRSVGDAPLRRAIVALSGSAVPDVALGAGPGSTVVRLERLSGSRTSDRAWWSPAIYLLAAGLVTAPVLALLAFG